MRSGLRIDDFYVVPKDFFLDIILPEANSLDNFNIHKTHFTAARNNISAAIRDAVHVYHVNPNKLFCAHCNHPPSVFNKWPILIEYNF